MKYITNLVNILFLFLLFTCNSFAQDSFIYSKENGKIIIDDNSSDLIDFSGGYNLEYREVGVKKKQKVKLKEIDSAYVGNFLIKNLLIGDSKKLKPFFVILETPTRFLLGTREDSSRATPQFTNQYVHIDYYYYVIDKKDNSILSTFEITSTREKTRNNQFIELIEVVRKEFTVCKDLVGEVIKNDEKNRYSRRISRLESVCASMKKTGCF